MKTLLIISFFCLGMASQHNFYAFSDSLVVQDPPNKKELAFKVLQTKCNVCHEQKNKRMIFTLDNMDSRGKKIYRQVFKWKRMPKGNEIKLTAEELTQLKSWNLSLNQK